MKHVHFRPIFNWIKQKKLFFLLLSICLATTIGTLIYLFHFAAPAITVTPYFSEAGQEGWEIYILENGKKILIHDLEREEMEQFFQDPTRTYYVSHKLEDELEDRVLRVDTRSHNICVFLDEQVLYADSSAEQTALDSVIFSDTVSPEKSSYVYVDLTADYKGKTLTVAQNQPDILRSGLNACTLSLSSSEGYIGDSSSYLMRATFVISLMTISAFIVIFFFLLECYQGYYDWTILLFAFSLLQWMTEFSLSRSQISMLDIPSSGAIYIFYRHFYVIPFLFFLCAKLQFHKKLYIVLVSCLQLAMLIMWVLDSPQILLNLINTATFLLLLLSFFILYMDKKHGSLFAKRFFIFFRFSCVALVIFIAETWVIRRDLLTDFILQFWNDVQICYFHPYNRMIAVFLMIFCTIDTFVAVYRHIIRRKLAFQSLELKQEHTLESFHHLKSYLRQTSMLRHDMRHHLSVLQYYLERQESENASSYLKELVHQETEIVPYVETANELVNMLLNSWLLSMNESNIDIHIQNLIVPDTLPTSSPDLCSLLTNLLKNAVEACEKAPPQEKPFLILEMYVRKNFFIISCKNSYYHELKRDKNGHLVSSKANAHDHGFGTYIVEKIAEKYSGLFDIQASDSIFTATVTIKLS